MERQFTTRFFDLDLDIVLQYCAGSVPSGISCSAFNELWRDRLACVGMAVVSIRWILIVVWRFAWWNRRYEGSWVGSWSAARMRMALQAWLSQITRCRIWWTHNTNTVLQNISPRSHRTVICTAHHQPFSHTLLLRHFFPRSIASCKNWRICHCKHLLRLRRYRLLVAGQERVHFVFQLPRVAVQHLHQQGSCRLPIFHNS
jgi:hypothetical protein